MIEALDADPIRIEALGGDNIFIQAHPVVRTGKILNFYGPVV